MREDTRCRALRSRPHAVWFLDKQLDTLGYLTAMVMGFLAIAIPATFLWTWQSVSDLSSWERWVGYGVYAWVMFYLFPFWRIFFTKKS